MRRMDKSKYKVSAYLERDNKLIHFRCRVVKRKYITTDIGQQMEASDKTLYTVSDYDFKANEKIRIGRQTNDALTIDAVDSEIIADHDGARRNNPIYEVKLEVS